MVTSNVKATPTVNSGYNYADDYVSLVDCKKLTDSTFMIIYQDHDTSYGYAKIGTVTNGVISFGERYTFHAGSTQVMDLAVLSPTKAIIGFNDYGESNEVNVIVATISGTTISFSAETVISSAGNSIKLVAMSDSRCVIAYGQTSPINIGVLGIDASNNVIFTPSYFKSFSYGMYGLEKVSSDKVIYYGLQTSYKFTICTISDYNVTLGASTSNGYGDEMIVLSETKFVVSTPLKAICGTINGSVITFGTELSLTNDGYNTGVSIGKLTSDKYVWFSVSSAGLYKMRLMTTTTGTPAILETYNNTFGATGARAFCSMSASSFVLAYQGNPAKMLYASYPVPTWKPSFTSTPVAVGSVNVAYSYAPTTNESSTITAPTLPAWASFDGTTVTGTPTESGSFPISIKAVSVAGTLTEYQNFSVEVSESGIWSPVFINAPASTNVFGEIYTFNAECNESVTYEYQLPVWAGLVDGNITGLANEVGTFEFVLNATSVEGTGTTSMRWNVTVAEFINDAPVFVETGETNVESGYYTTTISTMNATDIVSMASNASWITYNNNTSIMSGIAIAGSYWVNLTATSVNGLVSYHNYSLVVSCSDCGIVPPVSGSVAILNPEITTVAGIVMIAGFIGAWTANKKRTKWIFAGIIALGTVVFFYYDGIQVLNVVWSWFDDFQLLSFRKW